MALDDCRLRELSLRSHTPRRGGKPLWLFTVVSLTAVAQADTPSGPASSPAPPTATTTASATAGAVASAPDLPATPAAATRVALTSETTRSHTAFKPDLSGHLMSPVAATSIATPVADEEPIARALRTIRNCQAKFATISDYTCTFYKRERLKGRLAPLSVMAMKARTQPRSIYFKFEDPHKGREAIYVEGRNNGNILAHDVGFTKFLAGTMEIQPTSARAMEENRHPITDAGIGGLIDTVARRWAAELSPEETLMVFDSELRIGPRPCLMIESVHPHRQPHFQFYKVRLFIDVEQNLPIRFEGYDWPREQGGPADLLEEYSYIDLKLNVGLGDEDFDAANRQYSFGRF